MKSFILLSIALIVTSCADSNLSLDGDQSIDELVQQADDSSASTASIGFANNKFLRFRLGDKIIATKKISQGSRPPEGFYGFHIQLNFTPVPSGHLS